MNTLAYAFVGILTPFIVAPLCLVTVGFPVLMGGFERSLDALGVTLVSVLFYNLIGGIAIQPLLGLFGGRWGYKVMGPYPPWGAYVTAAVAGSVPTFVYVIWVAARIQSHAR